MKKLQYVRPLLRNASTNRIKAACGTGSNAGGEVDSMGWTCAIGNEADLKGTWTSAAEMWSDLAGAGMIETCTPGSGDTGLIVSVDGTASSCDNGAIFGITYTGCEVGSGVS